jgi:hypothetical protein
MSGVLSAVGWLPLQMQVELSVLFGAFFVAASSSSGMAFAPDSASA